MDGVDVDSPERMLVHQQMLARKRMMRDVFSEFHHVFNRLDKKYFSAQGLKIELGAGVAAIRNSYPDVLATDIVNGPGLDRTLNAQEMDLPDKSVRTLYGQNCFHHFPEPEKFFAEAERVLAPGGGIILLEPYYGPFASFLYKRLFKTEGFDKNFPDWITPVLGPMNGANQALSYIVFVRDRALFEKKFPKLKIVHQEPCQNHFKYLLSGGLNFIQLLPDWMSPVVTVIEKILSPLGRWIALHHIVVLRKDA
jgi:SAM-dependent methyltransferase